MSRIEPSPYLSGLAAAFFTAGAWALGARLLKQNALYQWQAGVPTAICAGLLGLNGHRHIQQTQRAKAPDLTANVSRVASLPATASQQEGPPPLINPYSMGGIREQDIQRLQNPNSTILSTVIDAYLQEVVAATNDRNGHTVMFVPMKPTREFLNGSKQIVIPDRYRHTLFIYSNHGHHVLVAINPQESTIAIYDSLENPTRRNNLFEQFKNKLDPSKPWTLKELPNLPQQKDGTNCGIFACYFGECLATDSEIRSDFDPIAMRRKILDTFPLKGAKATFSGRAAQFDRTFAYYQDLIIR